MRRFWLLLVLVGLFGWVGIGPMLDCQGRQARNSSNQKEAEKTAAQAQRAEQIKKAQEAAQAKKAQTAQERQARELTQKEEEDLAYLRKIRTEWTQEETTTPNWYQISMLNEQWKRLERLKETLPTNRGKAETARMQKELTKPFADAKEKIEAILQRIAATYNIKQSTEFAQFFDVTWLPKIQRLEHALQRKAPKEAGLLLRAAVMEENQLRESPVFWFLRRGYEDVLKPIYKMEFKIERKRRLAQIIARQPDMVINHEGLCIRRLRFSPDGTLLAVMNNKRDVNDPSKGGLYIYRVADGERVISCDHSSLDGGLSWSPDGKYVAAGQSEGTFRIFETATGQLYWEQRDIVDILTVIDLQWKGDHIAAAEHKHVVAVFRFKDMVCLYKEGVSAYGPRVMDFSVEADNTVNLLVKAWDLVRVTKSGKPEVIHPFDNTWKSDDFLAYHPGTKTVLWENRELKKVHRDDKEISTFTHEKPWGLSGDPSYARFSPNGKYVVFAGGKGFLHVHEVATGKEIFRARYCVGWMQDEFQHRSSGRLESLDLYATDKQVTVAVGGTLSERPVAIYKIDLP